MSAGPVWGPRDGTLVTLARNVSTRYVLIVINILIGMVMLRYNVHHLGLESYGLWMLAASITTYFGALELGYGGAVVRLVAELRARRDAQALNETVSTMFFVFSGLAAVCLVVAGLVAALLPRLVNLPAGQEHVGQLLLLMIALQVALYFPFSVYGGVINAFERYHLNNLVGIVFNIATALVNVLVLELGYGLLTLVAATTAMRIAPFFVYRMNAHRTFPELRISWAHFRRDRLRTLTGFSVYFAAIDWSSRLTYATDALYLGIFLNTAAVAIYTVAQRVSEALLTLTHQFHTFLFPAVIHRAIEGRTDSQQSLLIRATRFQLAVAMCLCGGVAAVAYPVLVVLLDSPSLPAGALAQSAVVVQILAFVVVLRAWVGMPSTLLKGTGRHRYLAAVSAGAALANLLLSIPLVMLWGIPGVALGTALPVLVTSAAFIFPAACRAVGLSTRTGYRQVVWPALWPALLTVALLGLTRPLVPLTVVPVLLHLAAGGLTYVALFALWGLSVEEREWMKGAAAQLRARRSARLRAAQVT